MHLSQQILGVALAMSAVMSLGWLYQERHKDASLVDALWALGLGTAAVFYASTGPGDALRRVCLGVLASAWGWRLGLFLLKNRVIGKPEDGRYQRLRAHWGSKASAYFYLFFLFQAGLVVLFGLPHLAVTHNPAPFGMWDIFAIAVAIIAVVGESISDRQLGAFRGNSANSGKTCRVGLWKYSRHPNYFFEWLHWFTYIFFCASGFGLEGAPKILWLSLAGPLLMYAFLMKITGVPFTEAQALKSRGDDYREYQRTTSMFFPWFPKK